MVGVGLQLLNITLTMSYIVLGDHDCEETLKSSISLYASASYILIVISALIVIVAFFGCCGAYKVNPHHHHLRNILNIDI